MKLSKAEEELMNLIWELKKGLLKDLLEQYPNPKPAITTIATLLKRMTDKGFVGYTLIGKSREYYPLISKNDYFSNHVNRLIKKFFNNSSAQFASFFTKETHLTEKELKELRAIIDEQIQQKKS
ncbi:MAG TPA: BlaI/MecI/CopY family transcriptional regulator [Flavobacteriia bacterium]|jgi:predicted transcriptional regulator|nr:BlaI/MecI/CopY family transcriptional regulator [Flavobacteriia bacterium]